MKDSKSVIERLIEILDAKNDTGLAKKLGIPRNTVSTWRNRGSIPYAHCVDVSERNNVSLDWLLTGRAPVKLEPERVDHIHDSAIEALNKLQDALSETTDKAIAIMLKGEVGKLRNAALSSVKDNKYDIKKDDRAAVMNRMVSLIELIGDIQKAEAIPIGGSLTSEMIRVASIYNISNDDVCSLTTLIIDDK